MAKENKSNIIIYQSEDGQTHIEVQMDEDTVWLSQQQMADLYQTSRTNVVEHIKLSTFMKMVNLLKNQPVGKSDRFDKKERAWLKEKFLTTILI